MEKDITTTEVFLTVPTVKSADIAWMKWADTIEGKYGANLGKQVFLAAWVKRGSTAANTVALRSHILKNYNIQVDESVWNKVADLGSGFADSLGKIFKVGKVVVIVGGSIALLALGCAIYNTVSRGTKIR